MRATGTYYEYYDITSNWIFGNDDVFSLGLRGGRLEDRRRGQ